jgi:hypothetical protein
MGKFFVRERVKVGRGKGKPRFVVTATEELDLKTYTIHLRKTELNTLAEAVGAEIVLLPRGEDSEEDEWQEKGRGGKKHRHHHRN